MFPEISGRIIAFDTETPDLNWHTGTKLFGFSVSVGGDDYYWDVRKEPNALKWLQKELPKASLIIAHNAKFDAHIARNAGIMGIDHLMDCTMIRAALIDEHRLTYDLDSLAEKYTNVRKDGDIYAELAEMFGGQPTRNAQVKNFVRAPVYLMSKYGKADSRAVMELWKAQELLIEAEGLRKVCNFERQLLPHILKMERNGVPVDIDAAERAVESIGREMRDKQLQLNNLAGFEVNPNPSGSITKLFEPKKNSNGLWVLNDGTIAEKTDGGKASINSDVLRKMTHPCAGLILRLRKLARAKDVFLSKHVLEHQVNGRVYPSINQTKNDAEAGTGTGRLSYTGPALQQISSRDKEMAEIVRSVFIPEKGQKWLKMDWAQMDFRLFAHYLNDPKILKVYEDDPDTDFHQAMADITGLPRSPRYAGEPNAKQMNLASVFGQGAGALADEMGLPCTKAVYKGREYFVPGPEAEAIFAKYHDNIPGVKALQNDASNVAKNRGYVRTVMDRHIHFPGGQFVHKAAGLIFQGSAADCVKVKMMEVSDMCNLVDSTLLLSVHDELGISIPDDEKLAAEFARLYCRFDGEATPFTFRVPIRCEYGIGPNWYEAGK